MKILDSKEISRLALMRADEIKRHNRSQKRLKTAGVVSGVCMLSVVSVIAMFQAAPFAHTAILDDPIPLASDPRMDFSVPVYESITVSADAVNVEIRLLNPEINSCWFTYELTLTDNGEVMFLSDLIAPGRDLQSVKLLKPFEKGRYAATLTICAYDPVAFLEIGSVNIEIEVIAS